MEAHFILVTVANTLPGKVGMILSAGSFSIFCTCSLVASLRHTMQPQVTDRMYLQTPMIYNL